MQGGSIMSFRTGCYLCLYSMTVAPTMMTMWAYIRGSSKITPTVSSSWLGIPTGRTGDFDEGTHEESDRPEELCGAQQARFLPDAELNSLTWSNGDCVW